MLARLELTCASCLRHDVRRQIHASLFWLNSGFIRLTLLSRSCWSSERENPLWSNCGPPGAESTESLALGLPIPVPRAAMALVSRKPSAAVAVCLVTSRLLLCGTSSACPASPARVSWSRCRDLLPCSNRTAAAGGRTERGGQQRRVARFG